eukprot:68284-Pyramimonas_sp.AAC.1
MKWGPSIWGETGEASAMHRPCASDASSTWAMHRQRRREANRTPCRAMHRRCGAILRPHLLRPHPGDL